MTQYFDLLGYKCQDLVTGFKGIAGGISYDLYGCIQVFLTPEISSDGKLGDSQWFDAKRLKKISKKPVMKQPDFSIPAGEERGGNNYKSLPNQRN